MTATPNHTVTAASSNVKSPSKAIAGWPGSAATKPEIAARPQAAAWIRSSTNTVSARPALRASGTLDGPDHALVEIDGEGAAGVGHDPDVQHRGHGHADRPQGTAGIGRLQVETGRAEADVLVLVPRGQRPARSRAEIADLAALEHGAYQHRPLPAGHIHQPLRVVGIEHRAGFDQGVVDPVHGARRSLRPVAGREGQP